MRAHEIVVGEDYEVKVWGDRTRATVLEVGKIEKKNFDRYSWGGYTTKRTRVRVKLLGWRDRDEVIETNQVLRPWSEAAPILEEKERLEREYERVTTSLERALKRAGFRADVARTYSYVHHKPLETITIRISLKEARRLRRLLRSLPKATKRRSRRATQVRSSLD